jgi:hypothetical protein
MVSAPGQFMDLELINALTIITLKFDTQFAELEMESFDFQ